MTTTLGSTAPAPGQAQPSPSSVSQLWGKKGERWDPQGRLPDFSYAGYHSGETPLPQAAIKGNVKDFGAKGDGVVDDTEAFKKAIAATENGALLIPAGRYLLTDILYIHKSNLVLQGEGPDKTVLFFPKALEQIKSDPSATTEGIPTSNYSWAGGLIWAEGKQNGALLGQVQTKALRGSNTVELDKAPAVKPGQRVEIIQEDPGDGSLLNHLYAGQSGDVSKVKRTRCFFVSKVIAVEGNKLILERPLRTDVDPRWKSKVRIFDPSVVEVGIENLCFEFPNLPYRGHFKEDGYNPVAFSAGTADCWARNLRILNADSGFFLGGSTFVTLDGIVFESLRTTSEDGETGHHGVTMGDDSLFQNFDFRTKFIHDISVEMNGGSVSSKGKGIDLCFDHHKRFPYANLFTQLDLGLGSRMYKCGGGGDLGLHSAAWATFWNIRALQPQHWPRADFGPDLMNFVGVTSTDAPVLDLTGRWFEPIPPAQLEPANLYEAQLARRLEKQSQK